MQRCQCLACAGRKGLASLQTNRAHAKRSNIRLHRAPFSADSEILEAPAGVPGSDKDDLEDLQRE